MQFAKLQHGLQSAQVAREPFPHLAIDAAFSPVEYASLIDELPSCDRYYWIEKKKARRGVIKLTPFALWRLKLLQRSAWARLTKLMLSEEFAKLVLSKFSDCRSPDGKPAILAPRLRLIRDKPGYHLQVHTDRSETALSLLLYLRSEKPELTTDFYKLREGVDAKGDGSWPVEFFEKIPMPACGPGSCLSFQRTETSFHALNDGKPINFERDLLIYTLQWRAPTERSSVVRRFQRSYMGNYDWPLVAVR